MQKGDPTDKSPYTGKGPSYTRSSYRQRDPTDKRPLKTLCNSYGQRALTDNLGSKSCIPTYIIYLPVENVNKDKQIWFTIVSKYSTFGMMSGGIDPPFILHRDITPLFQSKFM